jgi:hypothetical protein
MKASYLDQSGKKVTLSLSVVQAEYDRANIKFFAGKLPRVKLESVASKKFFGCIRYSINRRTRELGALTSLQLTHSVTFITKEDLINTLVHEMVHVWQYYFSPTCIKYGSSHGRSFKEWSKKINSIDKTVKITVSASSDKGVSKKRSLYFLINKKHDCFIAFSPAVLTEYDAFKEKTLKRFPNFKGTDFVLVKGETVNSSVKAFKKLNNRRSTAFYTGASTDNLITNSEIVESFTLKG